ncbi:unnamed protein product, partial [Iphiclides podalirius]
MRLVHIGTSDCAVKPARWRWSETGKLPFGGETTRYRDYRTAKANIRVWCVRANIIACLRCVAKFPDT